MKSPVMGLRLPPDLKREFAEIATKQNTTISALSRELIQNFVKTTKENSHATANH
ncbi:hypothetical protein RCF98_02540 [Thiothrix lacustris]|uniref:CopG-like ribbon-helix-helix domain-containing protein n=1 Tax=Thiothrix lacustris TaxID=525917 RepID=A0ABY9MRF8_9GAMM|nr:hypothetical protein [Thiothrix lacustris]WML91241.1 hypothetical protein RCF98_02540 [Thiothrix lacustris]